MRSLIIVALLTLTNAFTTDITGGQKECYMEKLEKGAHIAIYYQGLNI